MDQPLKELCNKSLSIKDGCSLGAFILISSKSEGKMKRKKIYGHIDDVVFNGIISPVIPYGNIVVIKKEILEMLDKKVGDEVWVKLLMR